VHKRTNTSKRSDVILGVTALIVVSGLCLKGAYSLYFETLELKKTTSSAVVVRTQTLI